MKLQRRALETGQIQISGVFTGANLKSPDSQGGLPVPRKDKPPLEIIIAMRPDIFLTLFEQWNLPEGWLAGLIDTDGNFIARSRNHEQNVGKPGSEDFGPRRAGRRWVGTRRDRSKASPWRPPMSPRRSVDG